MLSMGASEGGVRKVWDVPGNNENGAAKNAGQSQLHKALAHAAEDFYRQQFQPGDRLNELWPTVQNLIEEHSSWENISGDCIVSSDNDTKKLSLWKWCRGVLLSSVTKAIFGEQLLQLEPALLEHFVKFDDESWKLTYKLPRTWAKDMFVARDNIIATLERYFALPEIERADAAWVVHNLEKEMRHIQLEEKDIAALFTMPLWVYVRDVN